MSNYYYNEKKGRYESIDDAPLMKRGKLRRDKKDVFSAESYTPGTKRGQTEEARSSKPSFEIPQKSNAEKKKTGKNAFKGAWGLIIGAIWLINRLMDGDLFDGIRDFFEMLFN